MKMRSLIVDNFNKLINDLSKYSKFYYKVNKNINGKDVEFHYIGLSKGYKLFLGILDGKLLSMVCRKNNGRTLYFEKITQ